MSDTTFQTSPGRESLFNRSVVVFICSFRTMVLHLFLSVLYSVALDLRALSRSLIRFLVCLVSFTFLLARIMIVLSGARLFTTSSTTSEKILTMSSTFSASKRRCHLSQWVRNSLSSSCSPILLKSCTSCLVGGGCLADSPPLTLATTGYLRSLALRLGGNGSKAILQDIKPIKITALRFQQHLVCQLIACRLYVMQPCDLSETVPWQIS
jgi:hypothetical protein